MTYFWRLTPGGIGDSLPGRPALQAMLPATLKLGPVLPQQTVWCGGCESSPERNAATHRRSEASVTWLMTCLRDAWQARQRRRALRERLQALSAEDYQTVQAYLSFNARDETFIRAFLTSGLSAVQRRR